jgi:excisionase family DNA binding protein
MKKFYEISDVAESLSLNSEAILDLINTGRLRGYSIKGQVRIGEDDLREYLETCLIVPTKHLDATAQNDNAGLGTRFLSEPQKECPTFGGQAKFMYSGSVLIGTTIWPGKKASYRMCFDAAQWNALLETFRGKEARAGLNFSQPESGSFGEWIKINWKTKMGPAAYVGGILIKEGFAERSRPGWIRFFGAEKG